MIYKSIAERLRIRLNSADFTLNSLLPGEKKLAEEFAVSRMTIRKAIDLLVAWGLVVRRHGSGTYLVRKDVLHQTASLTGLVEVLKRQGKTVTSQVLIFEIMPAPPAIASQLRIQINEQIYFSRRFSQCCTAGSSGFHRRFAVRWPVCQNRSIDASVGINRSYA
ncbi:GntR family transcriptional regulator [Shigella flexneri]|nr:GntR family transcriptional regulator [Shigella flexneri]